MIADCLRRQADNFMDLASLRNEIGRTEADRPARRVPEESEQEYDFQD